ncbi:neuropeptide Y receptor type 2 [Aethina tumida]|uniref:neuropeptide Y receptor type 2 n=1 Tax=Aethina tumida TaxID=116153 RepID=UPI00096B2750|nr:neuropeptide Y receptor type 2 [Aethina tumida]XP_019867539.1 neuropeptide Y receptor type 2 [Aethina tumida]XP_049819293.1 neuropeptide Y receptor type 2 [Aethina tumida]XP_049819294.1 neuropeptide Y receptor type 2 [Aethina tumida]XP_049819295.1 neuropeptide Y receptor type 2 [Aethina tumida]XP_049819296.1 neuropeptide Y receptor type 2 [Aethina tumida]
MDWNGTNLTANRELYQGNKSDIINNELVQIIFFMIYTAIFILGIFGNVLVCYVVFRNKAMQTVTNLFITNLALSDILLCVLAVPFTPLYTFLGKWIFGSIICHLVPYAQGASVYISTLTLTSIAIDRFFVIIYPFHPRMKLSTCVFIINIIWLFSLLVTVPYGIYMKQAKGIANSSTYQEENLFCEEDWPSDKWRKLFGGLTTTLQFVIPFLIMAFCYICVSFKLNDRARSKPGSKNSRKEEADRDRKRRTNRMLISMVAIFLMSWLPLNTINIVNDFNDLIHWKYYLLSFFLVHALAMSSTCYNPFLYAWLNENFRKEFKQVLPCFEGANRVVNNAGRLGNWRSERTCNGNDTQQESLLPSGIHRAASVKEKKTIPPPHKTDSVEVENVLVPNIGVVYDSLEESVRLKYISEEEPPPYDTQQ